MIKVEALQIQIQQVVLIRKENLKNLLKKIVMMIVMMNLEKNKNCAMIQKTKKKNNLHFFLMYR